MTLEKFLNLVATLFGAVGSVYVLQGLVALSPSLIERLSRTYFDFNAAQISALSAQKADSIVGVVLVLIALAISVVNIALVPSGVRVFEGRGLAIAVAVALAATSYATLWFVGKGVATHQRLTVGRLIVGEQLDGWFKQGKIMKSDIPSLRVLARTLLDLQVDESESPRSLLQRVAKATGRETPPNFDLSDVEPPS